MKKRRLAVLAAIAGMNVLAPVQADGGNCKSCATVEIQGEEYRICVSDLSAGYNDCGGGFGTGLPCVNGPWSCPLED